MVFMISFDFICLGSHQSVKRASLFEVFYLGVGVGGRGVGEGGSACRPYPPVV